ncbi:hypothetical protein F9802_02190 [Bacillus aerolatus]|uniref:Uncharacterized protein n=1 Tax=Bacillus aerolatus TaxID=2653354 RepID=A0A6I1FKI1_9BACI|nr:hypothetical protein F9802_02190 [Bacillus aerolatus]
MKNRFHACATCRHFQPVKQEKGMRYFCSRLQYETKPNYKFNCWDPKDEVIKLMKKRIEEANEFDQY